MDKLLKENFSIICNNCIGGIIYNRLGLEFNSPFINLWIDEEDYFKLIDSLDEYLKYNIGFSHQEKNEKGNSHPVCKLNDIKLHCLHYNSYEEVLNSWNRRKERIIKDNIIYILVTNKKERVERFIKLKQENKICICPYKLDNKNVLTINQGITTDDWYESVIDYFKNIIFIKDIIKIINTCYKEEGEKL